MFMYTRVSKQIMLVMLITPAEVKIVDKKKNKKKNKKKKKTNKQTKNRNGDFIPSKSNFINYS